MECIEGGSFLGQPMATHLKIALGDRVSVRLLKVGSRLIGKDIPNMSHSDTKSEGTCIIVLGLLLSLWSGCWLRLEGSIDRTSKCVWKQPLA